ncbi:MAG TPA: TIGR03808 family TAT-translocated repetitive protein [Alphaproteobacteria bacterium]|nr:TIGR03808 family TAT-translocated repetitive protein [Alphaproteobacteria bacterium]
MITRLTRRSFLASTAALATLAPAAARGQAQAARFLDATDFGVLPGIDATEPMRKAVTAAAAAGGSLFLPAGAYAMGEIELPAGLVVEGAHGATTIIAVGDAPIFIATQAQAITLRDLALDGGGTGANVESPGLVTFRRCAGFQLQRLELRNGGASGIHLEACAGHIGDCVVRGFSEGIFSLDARGLIVERNLIADCANGAIRIWASAENGNVDGTLVAGNDIRDIRTDAGGSGQNGNGINIYRANGVMVTANRLRNCAFSAIRVNAGSNTIISGNTCLDSGEVAIFSEFGFSGSVIADNIIDRAAQGISITNFDQGGRLATCTGNIVRNIAPSSRVNPDTTAIGIFAEADAVIASNVVEAVPGLGIGAGWGPYLRNVALTGNLVRDVEIGIGVSVADGAGRAAVTGNVIAEARRAGIAGLAWREMVSDDLVRDAPRFPLVSISGNSVG